MLIKGLRKFFSGLWLGELTTPPVSGDTGFGKLYSKDADTHPYFMSSIGHESRLDETGTTQEPLTFSVDYEDAGAVDPPAGTLFNNQDDVDNFLTKQGATNFKHMMAVWDALPPNIAFDLTFNLAAGVHRPRPTDTQAAFDLSDKVVAPGVTVSFNGALASDYVDIVAETAAIYNGVVSDPQLDFSPATPFTGMDLSGSFVRTDQGQIAVIYANTNSVLYLASHLSPTPAAAAVVRQGTIIRNSLSGSEATPVASDYLFNVLVGGGKQSYVIFNDIRFDQIDVTWGLFLNTGIVYLFRTAFDYQAQLDDLGVTASTARPIQSDGHTYFVFYNSSVRGIASVDEVYISGNSGGIFYYSYFGGGTDPVTVAGELAYFGILRSIFKDVVDGAVLVDGGDFFCQDQVLPSGKYSTFINCGNINHAALKLTGGASMPIASSTELRFSDNVGPCVHVENGSTIQEQTSGTLFLDAGNNQDVGVQVDGPASRVVLMPGTTVTGVAGDVRIAGVVGPYADLVAEGPIVTTDLSYVEKLV